MSRRIILCSDGTNNKWGAGSQTNVSKLYQALCPKDRAGKAQIRFYDNGVGTSSNQIIRAVTGAFGFGLKRNVLDLYEFLARNYIKGDHIYLFGFSRGAATVRAFAGMLQECGLVTLKRNGPTPREEDLQRLLDLAMRTYQERKKPRGRRYTKGNLRKETIALDAFNHLQSVKITMIGAWDTVPALGFPKGWSPALEKTFVLLEWVADKLFPHSFYNYQLNHRVEHAMHALALDDERRSFHPTLWDETSKTRPNKIEQVWFSGVHSDIGGGYPRSGLSSITLDWMLSHAMALGLNFYPRQRAKIQEEANPHGLMHNSRKGAQALYRYAPRDLVRLCEIGPQWLRANQRASVTPGTVKVHHTVLERTEHFTARYAPALLPQSFEVVGGNVSCGPRKQHGADWTTARKKVLKRTLWRRHHYATLVWSSLALAAAMVLTWKFFPPSSELGEPPASFGGFTELARSIFGGLEDLLHWILPAPAESLVTLTLAEEPLAGLLLVLFGAGILWSGSQLLKKWQEAAQQARDVLLRASEQKHVAVQPQRPLVARSWQSWTLYSTAVAIAALLTVGGWQLTRSTADPLGPDLWRGECGDLDWSTAIAIETGGKPHSLTVDAKRRWNRRGLRMVKGNTYSVELVGADSWKDAHIQASVFGWNAPSSGLFKAARQLARQPESEYFQLIGAIQGPCAGVRCNTSFPLFQDCDDSSVQCETLNSSVTSASPRRMTFTAPLSGEFCAYANDLPFMYWNNDGAIELKIQAEPPTQD